MNECIYCLHYEACKDIHDILDTACSGEFDYEALARGCKNFTDRSEWVHLPCLVGDTVCVYEYDGETMEYCVRRKSDDKLFQFYAGTGKIMRFENKRGIHSLIRLLDDMRKEDEGKCQK